MMDKKMKVASSLLGESGEEVQSLKLEELVPFEKHPFRVIEDESFQELLDSIQAQGVAMPIIARPKGRGTFEIIAGHRRHRACTLLNLPTIPAFIRDLDDEEATLFMVDTNIQREALLFSEKAFAYKMKLEALKKQSKHQPSSDPVGQKKISTRDRLATNTSDSSIQIQRYIRLTHLLPELLALVDKKKLPFQTGVELSYLKDEEQKILYELMSNHKITPSLQQATKLKKHSQIQKISLKTVSSILLTTTEKPVKLSLKRDVSSYFPQNTTPQEMEEIILTLLKEWSKQHH